MTDAPALPAARKGAASTAAVDPAVLAALNAGTAETATLSEGLAMDFAALMAAGFPEVPDQPLRAAAGEGITRRMALAARLLTEFFGPEGALARARSHRSDTVRGWAAFVVGGWPGPDLAERLALVRPLADDPHFGVREWAWLALRPHVAAEPEAAVALLTPWTAEPSENLRRFATEATRPRGVWCAHIALFKERPEVALPLLEPLRADPSHYVRNSVANWLNDAGKTRPDWLRALADRWARESPGRETAALLKRGCRSLR